MADALELRLINIEKKLDEIDKHLTWATEGFKSDRKDIGHTKVEMAKTAEGQKQILNELNSQEESITQQVIDVTTKVVPEKVEKGIIDAFKRMKIKPKSDDFQKKKGSWIPFGFMLRW